MKKIISFLLLIILSSFFFSSCSPDDEFIIPEGTKFIAHRGLSSEYYQNSLDAFEGAGKSDFFLAIETDIWFTKDNKWVCAHDEDPFHDTSKIIADINYEEAVSLPLNPEKAGDISTDKEYYLCDFNTYLDTCKSFNKLAVIEFKCVPDIDQVNDVINIIKERYYINRVKIISFEKENIDNILSIDNSVMTEVLTSNYFTALSLIAGGYNIGVKETIISENLVKETHNKGLTINVWTVNNEEDIAEYQEWGVDYITTDYIFAT